MLDGLSQCALRVFSDQTFVAGLDITIPDNIEISNQAARKSSEAMEKKGYYVI